MLKMMITCFLAVAVPVALFAQQQGGSEELKRRQAEIQREIDDLRNTLKSSKKNTKAGLLQLSMVQKKLRLREQAINNINQQINVIEGTISKSKGEIERLKIELDTLKQQYAKSIVYAYKNRSNYDFLNFIFSASSFNDALRRVQYLRAYRLYREEQASTIKSTQVLYVDKIASLESSRKEKDAVLQKQEKQKDELESEKKEKNELLADLKAREKEIAKELTSKQRADIKLKNAIKAAITKEINAAREKAAEEAKARALAEARANEAAKAAREREREKEREREREREAEITRAKKANEPAPAPKTPVIAKVEKPEPKKEEVKKPESVLEATPEAYRISGSFENNRGKLPWPVEKGDVKIHFGTYNIEGTKLRGNNPGITLATPSGAIVRAVFEGEISRIFDIDGNWSVLIRHGKYFTVYSNLSSVSVSKDQKVSGGQMLGRAAANDEGHGEIEFLLMQENRNLDPERWIRGK